MASKHVGTSGVLLLPEKWDGFRYIVRRFLAFRLNDGRWRIDVKLDNGTVIGGNLPPDMDQQEIQFWHARQNQRALLPLFVEWLMERTKE